MNRRRRTLLLALAVAGSAAAGLILALGPLRAVPPKVERPPEPLEFAATDLATLQPHPITDELAVEGLLVPAVQAEVRARVAATVARVTVREGEQVRAGQLLAAFDPAPLAARLAERRAALASARATLAQAERNRELSARLAAQRFISRNASDEADSNYQAQRALVDAAQAQVEQAELQLADTVVRAPIAGVVARREVEPGEQVPVDGRLFTLVDLDRIEVRGLVSVTEVARVRVGDPAEVAVEGLAERQFAGRVERINPAAEPGSRSIAVHVGLQREGTVLRGGMVARLRIRPARPDPVPTLPLAAVRFDGEAAQVWVVRDDRLESRAVTAGRRDEREQRIELRGGLAEGEQVLAGRYDRLRDGQAVRIVPARAAATAPPAPAGAPIPGG